MINFLLMAHFKGHSIITYKIKNGSLSQPLSIADFATSYNVLTKKTVCCDHRLQMFIFSPLNRYCFLVIMQDWRHWWRAVALWTFSISLKNTSLPPTQHSQLYLLANRAEHAVIHRLNTHPLDNENQLTWNMQERCMLFLFSGILIYAHWLVIIK